MRPLLINTILMNQEQAHYCSIMYNGVRDVTYQSWQGALSSDDVAKGYHSSLNVLAKTACPNVINDCTGVSRMEAQRFGEQTQRWFFEALGKGVKYLAHVTSEEVPVEPFAALRAKAQQEGRFEMEIFDNVDEALLWIAFKNEFGGVQ